MTTLQTDCLWWRDLALPETDRLVADHNLDVAIIGAGFTGLWTAWFLKQLKPDWRIALFDQQHPGFGASGRNGGWLIGGIEGQDSWLTKMPPDQRQRSQQLLYGIVESVKQQCQQYDIDCDLRHEGVVYSAARYPEQTRIAQLWLHSLQQAGHRERDFRWLSHQELEPLLQLPKQQGGIYSPHCATINPAKLIAGLCAGLRRQGVTIYAHADVSELGHRTLRINNQFNIQAETIVVATEAFPGRHKALAKKRLPVFSAVIATKTLTAEQWQGSVQKTGLAFADVSRSVTYGQRTANDELVFGARGGYLFGKRSRFEFTPDEAVFDQPKKYRQRLFPHLDPADVAYQWGGSLAMSRRFSPYCGYDASRGLATAGGYGGEGVGASHLFGHTLAELIAGEDSARTQQPWVSNHFLRSQKNWEPEPIPWLAYQGIGAVLSLEDYVCHYDKLTPLRKPIVAASEWLAGFLHSS